MSDEALSLTCLMRPCMDIIGLPQGVDLGMVKYAPMGSLQVSGHHPMVSQATHTKGVAVRLK